MGDLRYDMYTSKKGKPLELKALPPTEQNLLLHVKRANLQVVLGKAASEKQPPDIDINDYGWEIVDSVPYPMTHKGLPGPAELLNVVSCTCKAAGKACSTLLCSCHKARMPCADFCDCSGLEGCYNPNKVEDIEQDSDESTSDNEELE